MKQPGNSEERTGSCDPISEAEIDEALEESFPASDPLPWTLGLEPQVDRAGLPLVSHMISQDLTDDPDPSIGEKIAEVHRNRYAGHPDLLDLIKDLGSYEGSGVAEEKAPSV